MNDQRISKLAPPFNIPSAEKIREDFVEMLRPYCLQSLERYSVLLEGWTDVSYIEIAIHKYRDREGIDLDHIVTSEGEFVIKFCTPGKGGDPKRGGTPQMIRFATQLSPYVFTLGCVDGIIFVFDHDDEGTRAENQICSECGYIKEKHTLTLSPKKHPNACAKKQVVIEDLLSLDIQTRFFEQGNTYCDVVYEAGKIVRFKWDNQSKSQLRDYVRENAALEDLKEIISLVNRIRSAWGATTENGTSNLSPLASLHPRLRER